MWCQHVMQSLNLGFMHTLWLHNSMNDETPPLSQDLCIAIYSCDKAQMLLMLQILGMIYTAGTQLGPSFLSCCCCSWSHTWKPMLQTAPNVTLFLNQAIQCDHAQMLTHVADFGNDTAVFVLPDSSKIQLIKLQISLMLQIFKRMLLQGSSTFARPFLCFCCCRGSHTWCCLGCFNHPYDHFVSFSSNDPWKHMSYKILSGLVAAWDCTRQTGSSGLSFGIVLNPKERRKSVCVCERERERERERKQRKTITAQQI